MKAIRIHSYGHADQLKLEDVPRPKLEPDEVMVRVRDAGVNPIDWKIREGLLKNMMPASFPLAMGQDFAGEIIEAGSKVKRFSQGDRVLGFARGSYAQFAVAPGNRIARIPESISDEFAAGLPTAGLTAYQLVVKVAQVSPDKTILIHGAAGGVGSIATQIAVQRGATVFGTAAEKDIPYLQQLGARRAIDYKKERFEDAIKNVDVVIDLIGGETQRRSFPILGKNGLLVTTVGFADPDLPKTFGIKATEFYMDLDATNDLEAVVNLAGQGLLKCRVGQVIPLERASDAQQMNETGKTHGKVILKVA